MALNQIKIHPLWPFRMTIEMIKLLTCTPGTFSVQKSTHLSTDMFSMSWLMGRAMETLSGWRKHPRNIALPSAREKDHSTTESDAGPATRLHHKSDAAATLCTPMSPSPSS